MKKRKIVATSIMILMCLSFGACEMYRGETSEMKGNITGNTYHASFYSNTGEKFMSVKGENIDINENVVKQRTYSDGSWGWTETTSSVLTVTIDGSEMASCGSTIIFAENGLEPDVDYVYGDIVSSAEGIGDLTMVANVVNRYKNMIGKSMVVVVQSQLGDPICAYSGESVYYKVCEDLPKTTMLSIDGKLLYIHRANFQIIDKDLLGD